MTLTKPKVSEREIAAAVVNYLTAQGLKVRQEVPCVLPDIGLVTADIVAMKADETGEYFTVVECKVRLDAKLEMQSRRWIGYAHRVIAAYLIPRLVHEQQRQRAGRMDSCGIGRALYIDDVEPVEIAHQPAHADFATNGILSNAFHSHDGSQDLPAGSKTGRRMNASRCQYNNATKTLKSLKSLNGHHGWLSWFGIKKDNPTDGFIQTTSAARALKDAQEKVWTGVEWNAQSAPTVFRYCGRNK
jgi:hypothetical protein